MFGNFALDVCLLSVPGLWLSSWLMVESCRHYTFMMEERLGYFRPCSDISTSQGVCVCVCVISHDYIQCALSCADLPFLTPSLPPSYLSLPPSYLLLFSPSHLSLPFFWPPYLFLPSLPAYLSPSPPFLSPSLLPPSSLLSFPLSLPPPRDSVDSGLLRVSKFDKSKRQDRPRPLQDVEARAHLRKGIDTQVQVRQKTCPCKKSYLRLLYSRNFSLGDNITDWSVIAK